jgi:hypothetical protein
MHLEILVEEESAQTALEVLLPKIVVTRRPSRLIPFVARRICSATYLSAYAPTLAGFLAVVHGS